MIHENFHVLDLEKSLAFYEKALGLNQTHTIESDDGSWRIVYVGNDTTGFELELTWNKGRTASYDNGSDDTHLAFEVPDIKEAHTLHESMGCIVFENPEMGIYFIEDPDGCWLEILPPRE